MLETKIILDINVNICLVDERTTCLTKFNTKKEKNVIKNITSQVKVK